MRDEEIIKAKIRVDQVRAEIEQQCTRNVEQEKENPSMKNEIQSVNEEIEQYSSFLRAQKEPESK